MNSTVPEQVDESSAEGIFLQIYHQLESKILWGNTLGSWKQALPSQLLPPDEQHGSKGVSSTQHSWLV
jgi:hypothetical protein